MKLKFLNKIIINGIILIYKIFLLQQILKKLKQFNNNQKNRNMLLLLMIKMNFLITKINTMNMFNMNRLLSQKIL